MTNRKRNAADEPRKTVHKKRKPARQLPPPEPTFRLTSLPPEIQTLIWKFAISIVPARRVCFEMESKCKCTWIGEEPFCSRPFIPAPLHVCHLSRQMAQQRWQLLSASELWAKSVYFDRQADTLVFADRQAWRWYLAGITDNQTVRNVELEW